MKTDHEVLDPTETDQSELIIDPETVTQWVDEKLPVPHMASVDSLAQKFSSLRQYGDDAKHIGTLINEAYCKEIQAPADTISRVLEAIKTETQSSHDPFEVDGRNTTEQSNTHGKQAPGSVPLPDELGAPIPTLEPFIIPLPDSGRKLPRYLMPLAALLFLSALVGSIILSERHSNELKRQQAMEKKESLDKTNSKVPYDHKAAIMSNGQDPHSPNSATPAQLTIYDMTNGVVPDNSEELKKENDKEEEKPVHSEEPQ